MKKRILINLIFCLALFSKVWAQSDIVSGKVTSGEDGMGLPGVNVVEKGSTNGVLTDLDGNFSIEVVGNNSSLVFSFVGMVSQEIVVGTRSTIDVKMLPDTKQLEEVVVLGYATTEDPVTQVQKISDINKVKAPNFTNALMGRAAGVAIRPNSGAPGTKPDIYLRGIGSLAIDSDPLYVIDGVMVDTDNVVYPSSDVSRDPLGSLNPDDIEEIKILKDASATAIYGSRAANGVILVTTKRGKEGKMKFTFSGEQGVVVPTFGNMEILDADQFVKFYKLDTIPEFMEQGYENTDWLDLAWNNGSFKNYQFNASGGTKKNKYFISGGYNKQEGTLLDSDFERLSSRFNMDTKLSERFKMFNSINISYVTQNEPRNGYADRSPNKNSLVTEPIISPYDEEGNLIGAWEDLSELETNFLYENAHKYHVSRALNLALRNKISFEFTNDLSVSSANSLKMESIIHRNFWDRYTGFKEDVNGELEVLNGFKNNFITTNLLHYNKNLGEGHRINALAGMEYQHYYKERSEIIAQGFGEGLSSLRAAADVVDKDGFFSEYIFVSLLSKATYSYKDKYSFTASLRRDGSSKFGVGNQFGTFYSLGSSWLVSEEDFLAGSILSLAKLRASFGTTGNARLDHYGSRDLFSVSENYNGENAVLYNQINNPDLTWEKRTKSNVGLDVEFNKRLMLNVDVFYELSSGLLVEVDLPREHGTDDMWQNIGEMENKGIELQLSSRNLAGEFKWTTDFNVGFVKNRVLKLYDDEEEQFESSSFTVVEEGFPAHTFFLREYYGANPANGLPAFYLNRDITGEEKEDDQFFQTKDGRWASTDKDAVEKKHFGSGLPLATGGLTNTFNYKGFDLSILFTYSLGNEIYNRSRKFLDSDGNTGLNVHVMALEDRWENPGDEAYRPVLGNSTIYINSSSRFLEDGSFLSLRSVRLGYKFPSKTLSKVRLSQLSVFALAQNIYTWTKYTGFNPATVKSYGVNYFEYPEGKVFSAGVTVGF
ncbi:SusC/RagA family TonB-linked outer membrane protein [Xanthovirga aplysinae]|uniref:SusC/RagA family TonB-linked outer membrane protein n=1 Tax=Xanthovirga aplysinae TaxID=2529853 RepID=UPI0012BD30A4|nr:TonB-dependent receptor [Xanthovirga aplysinae]MTI30504.1 TonB-dependent receptor [Xanthovirga aplysinae]